VTPQEEQELREKIIDTARWRAITDESDRKWLADSIMVLLKAQAAQVDVAAIKLQCVEHIMSVKTEGLFDNGDLFIKRAPIEQAAIDLIGYEAFKAIQESIPSVNLEQLYNQKKYSTYEQAANLKPLTPESDPLNPMNQKKGSTDVR
jgi:hypothetical protein